MEVKWTSKAIESFTEIIEFLSNNWTQKEVDNFIENTDRVLEIIRQNPYSYIASKKKKNIRRGLIGKITSKFYRVKERKKEIEILLFWDNRKNPEKIKV